MAWAEYQTTQEQRRKPVKMRSQGTARRPECLVGCPVYTAVSQEDGGASGRVKFGFS